MTAILGGGAAFCLAWASGIAFSVRPYRNRRSLIVLLLCAGLWLASALAESEAPILRALTLPVLCFAGPVLYLHFRTSFFPESRGAALHFSAGLVLCAAAALLVWHILPAPFGRDPALLPAGLMIAYLAGLAFQVLPVLGRVEFASTRWIVFTKVLVLLGSFCALFAARLLEQRLLTSLAEASLALIVFVSYAIAEARPDLLTDLARQVRYNRSRLIGVDTSEIQSALQRLMVEEKAFADEDLSLSGLAELVGVKPHQLSEFLNVHEGRTFPDYINDFRIQEAQRMLIEERKRTTLSIAYAVGFESKSTFYRAFKKRAGIDPTVFRARG
jgi:AraC-like DNA-binding protein